MYHENNVPMHPADVDDLSALPLEWWIAHTKSRFEKKFAWWLGQRNVNYFIPLCITRDKRRRESMSPMFNGYVFVNGVIDDCRGLSDYMCRGIQVLNQKMFVNELMRAQVIAESGIPLADQETSKRIKLGQKCKVIRGGCFGQEGYVEDIGPAIITLRTAMLGASNPLEVDREDVEIIEG